MLVPAFSSLCGEDWMRVNYLTVCKGPVRDLAVTIDERRCRLLSAGYGRFGGKAGVEEFTEINCRGNSPFLHPSAPSVERGNSRRV